MPAKNAKNESDGFSTEERAAMKERAAELRARDLWPVSYALKKWTPVVEKKVVELVKAATS
jgi:hypothetical protein